MDHIQSGGLAIWPSGGPVTNISIEGRTYGQTDTTDYYISSAEAEVKDHQRAKLLDL